MQVESIVFVCCYVQLLGGSGYYGRWLVLGRCAEGIGTVMCTTYTHIYGYTYLHLKKGLLPLGRHKQLPLPVPGLR